MHGWGVGRHIEQVSGVFSIKLASLYSALDRLHAEGLVAAEWRMSENNRRARYYKLTRSGRRRLETEQHDWQLRVAGISRILAVEST
jgi:DNA-binding PadR family transcriptional regulator